MCSYLSDLIFMYLVISWWGFIILCEWIILDSLYSGSGLYIKLLKDWSSDTWTDMDLLELELINMKIGVRFKGFWLVFWWDWCSWIYSCGYSRFYPWLYCMSIDGLIDVIFRCRGTLDSILLEDVLLFIHSNIRWPSWSWGHIFSVSWLVLDTSVI